MTRKLPVWLEDQDGHPYHVKLDSDGWPYIIVRRYERPLSMNDVIDKPVGHTFTWGMWGFTEYTFTVTRNDRYQGDKDLH